MNESKLSSEKLDNLIAFTKLYGYVKYFHPSRESENFDWKTFAQYGTRKILEAQSKEDVLITLRELFQPIASSLSIYSGDDNSSYDTTLYTPSDTTGYQLIRMIHEGYGGKFDRDKKEQAYCSYVEYSGSLDTNKTRIIEKDLGNGLRVTFPSRLYFKDKTFPNTDEQKLNEFSKTLFEESKEGFNYEDKAYSIGNVIIAWNILQHFFPYLDVIDKVASGEMTRNEYWENILVQSLQEAYSGASLSEHLLTLQHMVSALRDGHGFVFQDEAMKIRSRPPIKIEWIEDAPVVVKSNDDSKDISEGDVILEVDDKNVNELIKESEERISASTDGHMKILSVQIDLLKGKFESNVKIKVRKPDGTEKTKTLARTEGLFPLINFPYYDEFFEADSGIYYVNITKLKWEVLQEKLDTIANAKGVIFDLRGYPTPEMYKLLQHLTDTNIKSSKWLVPRVTAPDFENVEFVESGVWDLPPLKPRINAKVIFLTNARAVSYGESVMAIVKNYNLGTIIGTGTAGTNGDVNNIYLPGDITISFTGLKVLNHDSSRFHGVGVIPDIEVNKTIKGVSEKRDEQMEKALKFIKN